MDGLVLTGGRLIRTTNTTPKMVSVIDVIKAITEKTNKYASDVLKDLAKRFEDVSGICRNFKFAGQGQRETPVTDAKGIVTIVNLLPGTKAAEFRASSADIIVRFLGGDETLIADIKRNRELQETASGDHPMRLFGEAVELVREEVALGNQEAWHIRREKGKVGYKAKQSALLSVLHDNGVQPTRSFFIQLNADTGKAVLGMAPHQFKRRAGIAKYKPTRDHATSAQLAAFAFAEEALKSRIVSENLTTPGRIITANEEVLKDIESACRKSGIHGRYISQPPSKPALLETPSTPIGNRPPAPPQPTPFLQYKAGVGGDEDGYSSDIDLVIDEAEVGC